MRSISSIVATAVLAIGILAAPQRGFANAKDDGQSECKAKSKEGDDCWIAVKRLKPTQLTKGAIEVERRAATYARLSKKDRQAFNHDDPIPVVIGPDGDFFITDHHHKALAIAAIEGHSVLVHAMIQKNWRDLSHDDFWAKMSSKEFTYLFDEFDRGPFAHDALGDDLFSLADDPYRSLAWGVRKNHGYAETTIPHADFEWANYFRPLIERGQIENEFDQAIVAMTPTAHAQAARHLPGYSP